MNDWLKAKTFGLPRWAWLTLLGGGVIVGLYLRSRSVGEEEEEGEDFSPLAEGTLSEYYGTDAGAGLAGLGVLGPAAGTVTPVEAPYIPEGIVDIIQGQSEMIGALATREPGERVEVIREVETPTEANIPTGGGPPKREAAREQRKNNERKKAQREVNRLTQEINKLRSNIRAHPKAKKRKGWEKNIKHKEQQRAKWQAKLR